MFEKYIKTEGFRPMPICGGRYSVNCLGNIVDARGNLVKVTHGANGKLTVNLNIWWAPGDYDLALIMVIVFKGLKIGYSNWCKVVPFHIDGDLSNIHPSNLGYRFTDGKLESKYPGYYHIPMFTGYAVNTEGVALRISTGERLNWGISKPGTRGITGGYHTYGTLTDTMHNGSFSRHRMLLLVFKGYPDNVDVMVSNHIDGVPGHDMLDNLELITKGENNRHASLSGLKQQNNAVLIRSVATGEVKEFVSINMCAEWFNLRNAEGLRYSVAQGNQYVHKGHQLQYVKDFVEWAEPHPGNDTYTVKRLSDGVESIHTTLSDAGNRIGVNIGTAVKLIHRATIVPVNGYLIRRTHNVLPWPTFTDEELAEFANTTEVIANKPKVLIAEDTLSGEILEFPSMHKLCQFLNTTARSRITKILNKHGVLPFNKYILRYKTTVNI